MHTVAIDPLTCRETRHILRRTANAVRANVFAVITGCMFIQLRATLASLAHYAMKWRCPYVGRIVYSPLWRKLLLLFPVLQISLHMCVSRMPVACRSSSLPPAVCKSHGSSSCRAHVENVQKVLRMNQENDREITIAVSYTHLTLPTKRIV